MRVLGVLLAALACFGAPAAGAVTLPDPETGVELECHPAVPPAEGAGAAGILLGGAVVAVAVHRARVPRAALVRPRRPVAQVVGVAMGPWRSV